MCVLSFIRRAHSGLVWKEASRALPQIWIWISAGKQSSQTWKGGKETKWRNSSDKTKWRRRSRFGLCIVLYKIENNFKGLKSFCLFVCGFVRVYGLKCVQASSNCSFLLVDFVGWRRQGCQSQGRGLCFVKYFIYFIEKSGFV